MNEQNNSTSAAFMEVTYRKVEGQDKRIAAIEEKIDQVIIDTDLVKSISNNVIGLQNSLKSIQPLSEKMEQLSTRLGSVVQLFQQPIPHKVIHHHHIPKLTWIAGGLFLALCLICSGWFITDSKLKAFTASDTKYRKLRLDTANRNLQLYLDRLDSLYAVMPDMREEVLAEEAGRRLNFERLEKAERLKAEAKELEKAAKRKQ